MPPARPIGPGKSRPAGRARITYRRDRIRGACAGVLETGALTFGLVVAIRYFEAPQAVKALVSAANAIGLLLTPMSLFVATRLGWTASRAGATNLAVGAGLIFAAAAAPSLAVFVPAMVLASVFLSQQAPLMVHIYTANYAPSRRGRLLSTSIVLSLVTAIAFSTAGGHFLDRDIGSYRVLFGLMAAAALVSSRAVAGMPAEPFVASGTSNPLAALRYAREDRVFGWMLVVWMLMGFGNLLMLPLRVEYLANDAFGINASNMEIAVVTAVVPSVVRLGTTHLWGVFFDRYNFFVIRSVLNGFFLLAILTFFSTRNLWVIGLAGVFLGLAMAGGNIAWNLWVTKFAPPGRASDYMSVHTFLTGVRGIAAPFAGFWLIVRLGALPTACIGAGLIALSMVLLDPLRRRHRDLEPAAARSEGTG